MGGGGGSGADLSSVIASTCMDLDSTNALSYTSGTTWKNLVAAPADCAAKTDYDFFRGTDGSTDAPTFTGSAGTTGAYWALNGTYFTIKSGTNTPLFNNMHKTSGTPTPLWFAFAGRSPASGTGAFGGTGATNSGEYAMDWEMQTNLKPGIQQTNNGATVIQASTAALSGTTDSIFIVSCDCTLTTNSVRFWINSRTKEEKNVTFGSASADATHPMMLAGVWNHLQTGVSGALGTWRARTFAAGNAFIDDATAAIIFNTLNTRHALTYA